MSGTGALGDYLAKYLKEKAAIKRVRADTFGYLQRSFPGIASEVDVDEAGMAGYAAVQAALLAGNGIEGVPVKGTIGIGRAKGKKYKPEFVALPAQAAAKYTRSVPDEYIAKNGHDVTQAFIDYVKPLIGELPHCEIF
jgi:6-phosphofructokinase 1